VIQPPLARPLPSGPLLALDDELLDVLPAQLAILIPDDARMGVKRA
jgi:hypothetical protein